MDLQRFRCVKEGGKPRIKERLRRFRTYRAYRDSGVEWLGEIPVHWDVCRADSFLRFGKVQIEPSTINDEFVFHYSIPSVQESGDGRLESPSEIDSAKLQILGERLLVSKLNPRKGVVLLADQKDVRTVCSTEFVPLEVRGPDKRWALYLFLAETTRQRLSAVVRSATRSHQRAEVAEIVKMWHAVPPALEQHAIADFLDRETARIAALVAKKERLIELLEEKRTALIARVVTKGLDPKVPVKDSGVEWLGEIPAHWEIAPVYARYEVALGKMLDAKRLTGESSGYYLRNVDVQWDAVNTEDLPQMDFALWERDRYLLRPGDLLVCEGGEVGRTAIWRGAIGECFYQKAIHRVRPRSDKEAPRFFYYLMHTLAKRGAFIAGGNQNTIDHLTAVQLKHRRLPFAPPLEQRAIAALLDRETARINGLIVKVLDAINHLKELRTALISGAVTGKIDVREEVA